ncbi:hypothetical protein KAR48_13390 [bacterium]|nr:hypothetical protein [bacterium]
MSFVTAKNCPCPADCSRHGDCKACIAYHKKRGDQTCCDRLESKLDVASVENERAESGRQIRLMDYGACAG